MTGDEKPPIAEDFLRVWTWQRCKTKGRDGQVGGPYPRKGRITIMDPDEDLRAQLRLWQVKAEVPPSFQAEVWRKIAARQAVTEKPPSTVGWIEWLIGRLGHPRYAVPVGLAILTVSLASAHVQADLANGRTWRTLESRYVVSVDPVAMAQVKQ